MESKARTLLSLDADGKRVKDEFAPIRDTLLSEMQAGNVDEIALQDATIKLMQKKTKKSVSAKQMLALAKDLFGESEANRLKAAMEESRGEEKVSHAIKIVRSG